MDVLVIYGGRFHPAHLGHKSVYDGLGAQFGAENVYVVSSNKQAPLSSPFSFEDKQEMWKRLGVPADHFVQVKNPYMPAELTDRVDGDKTAIIFAVSEKDAQRFDVKPGVIGKKKDGSPAYMQSLEGTKNLEPLSKHGYIAIAPTVDFKVLGKEIKSASEIRGMYLKAGDPQRMQILKDLYGKPDKQLKSIFDKKLALTENILALMMHEKTLLEGKNSDKVRRTLTKARVLESKIRRTEFKH